MLTKKLSPCAAQIAKSLHHSHHHSYATVSNSDSSFQRQTIWPSTPHPTPYQILEMSPTSPKYSKSRFAELVKLYHPDRAASVDPRCAHLPHTTRLERYHMVITAHDILSNPDKRLAYDRFGTGWRLYSMPPPAYTSYNLHSASTGQYHSYSGHPRGFDPYSARMNATWEDWEHWRASRAEKSDESAEHKGEPVYVPHGVFATVLFVASITAGVAQHKSAKSIADKRGVIREQSHDNAMREYERRKKEKDKISRDERIEKFARSRDSNSEAEIE
jgi:curved DNA-binding protein CbpA